MSALLPRAMTLKLEELFGFAQPVSRAEHSGIGDQDGGPPPVYPGCLGGIVIVKR